MSALSAQSTFDESDFLEKPDQSEGKFLKIIEPDYSELIEPRSSRRMSNVVKMGVAAARRALNKASVDMPDAVVVGTGLGCSTDTEKFLKDMIEGDEGTLSPTAFIQSTHNTIAGQIALLLNCTAYNFTYTNRGHSFENALKDAEMLIAEGCEKVLLGGIDEATPMVHSAFFEMGCVGDNTPDDGLPVLGEGASFFVLSPHAKRSLACLEGGTSFGRLKPDELEQKLNVFLTAQALEIRDIDTLVLGYNKDSTDRYYAALRSYFHKDIAVSGFKNISGEYFTAVAFGVHLAVRILNSGRFYPDTFISGNGSIRPGRILIYNHYEAFNHTFVLVSK